MKWCYHLSVMCPERNPVCACLCVFEAGCPGRAGNGAQMENEFKIGECIREMELHGD